MLKKEINYYEYHYIVWEEKPCEMLETFLLQITKHVLLSTTMAYFNLGGH
jgi:hypothetical protein